MRLARRLRTFCSNTRMMPARDATLLMATSVSYFTDISILFFWIIPRSKHLHERPDTRGYACRRKKWSLSRMTFPNFAGVRVLQYNVLGLRSQIVPERRLQNFTPRLAFPVNGKDMLGTTALSHCFSTNPTFDFEYTRILFDAGGHINNRK